MTRYRLTDTKTGAYMTYASEMQCRNAARAMGWTVFLITKADAQQETANTHMDAALSGSVNAAVAFVRCVLPGWGWSIGVCSVSDDAYMFPDFNCPVHGERLKAELTPLFFGEEWADMTDIDQRPPGNPARALVLSALAALALIERVDA